jgi:hypothetical protein
MSSIVKNKYKVKRTYKICNLQQRIFLNNCFDIKKELEKPEKDQDKALLLKALRATFKPRRKFIQETEDGNIKAVVQKYPLLKVTNSVSSFYLILLE